MSDSAFWFFIVLIGAGFFLMFFIEWLYRKFEPKQDQRLKEEQDRILKEINRIVKETEEY